MNKEKTQVQTKDELFDILHMYFRSKLYMVFIFGGLALGYYDLKTSTKDVDLVFKTERSAEIFIEEMNRRGFHSIEDVHGFNIGNGSRYILESDVCRFDIFVLRICRALSLSSGMIERSRRIPFFEEADVHVLSLEDIFLLKGITERPTDLYDMSRIASGQLDWNVIESEVRSQKDSWRWILKLYLRLLDLEDEYGVRSPLIKRFEKESDIYAGMTAVLLRFPDGKADLEQIAEVLEGDREYAMKVIEEIKKRDLIHSD